MKIAFLDPCIFNYSIKSVNKEPLGGSQSALCYLASNLAELGHDVFLVNNTNEPAVVNNVACLPINCVNNEFWQNVDFIISLNSLTGRTLKNCSTETDMILWNQHAHDQPAILGLHEKEERDFYSLYALISDWQSMNFIDKFSLDKRKIEIFRNAISPVFENMFDDKLSILKSKKDQITLGYTSTPFRGLELLVDIFPIIQQHFPDVKLKIFSSMKVYQVTEDEDKARFGKLYESLDHLEGVEYIGSISQPELAKELKKISVLVYPNTFPETSCIAVMEAMASGCHIVTSDLGALPETTAGFATLIPIDNDLHQFKIRFAEAVIDYISRLKQDNPEKIAFDLNEQIDYCHKYYTWHIRSKEWERVLYRIKYEKFLAISDYFSATKWLNAAVISNPNNLEYYLYLVISYVLSNQSYEGLITLLSIPYELMKRDDGWLEKKIDETISILENKGDLQSVEKINNFFSGFCKKQ